jgi:hypothetical protein
MNAGLFSLMLASILIISYILFYAINTGLLPLTIEGNPYGFRSFAITVMDLFLSDASVVLMLFSGAFVALYSRAPSSALALSFLFTILALAAVAVLFPIIKTILPLSVDSVYASGLLLLERVLVIYSIFILLIEAISAGELRNF